MPAISRQVIVPYSPAQMYALVNDVEKYPAFLPWCKNSRILYQTDDEIHAFLDLAKGGIHKSFTTCNRLQRDKMIEVRLLDGPFDHLEGMWRFNPYNKEGCQVCFDLEFSFASKLANFAFGPVFHQIANTLIDAFHQRAQQLYGVAHSEY